MKKQTDLELEIKQLIVNALNLEDLSPENIDSRAPLFVEGLGLDSIDALELAVALSKKYKVKIEGKAMDYRQAFSSVQSLASFIAEQKDIKLDE
jgi:acyl carrier protein